MMANKTEMPLTASYNIHIIFSIIYKFITSKQKSTKKHNRKNFFSNADSLFDVTNEFCQTTLWFFVSGGDSLLQSYTNVKICIILSYTISYILYLMNHIYITAMSAVCFLLFLLCLFYFKWIF